MERGLLVELSPHELTALMSAASGGLCPDDIKTRHVARLTLLALVEVKDKRVVVTEIGERRLAGMPRLRNR